MELIIAILIAMGSLLSPDSYTDAYVAEHSGEIAQAKIIIDMGAYERTSGGGAIIDEDVNP